MSHGGPPLYRCAGCGCPVLDHAVDDEERRECTQCECRQYLGGVDLDLGHTIAREAVAAYHRRMAERVPLYRADASAYTVAIETIVLTLARYFALAHDFAIDEQE